MHELSIAQSLVEETLRILDKECGAGVTAVTVSVGDLSGVEADALATVFPFAAEGTPMAGAELRIEKVAARIRCNSCGSEKVVEAPFFPVCDCGSFEVEVLAGRELLIRSVEIETGV